MDIVYFLISEIRFYIHFIDLQFNITVEKDDEHLIQHIDKFKFTKSKSKIMKYAKSF